MKEKIKLYQGYFIIFILSLICIFFLPLIGGSTLGLAFAFPSTAAGWVIWIVSKLAVILINMLTFDQFVRQAKINVKDDPRFIEAQEIFNMLKTSEEEYLPYPNEYLSKLYRNKGTKVFITSGLSLIAFSNAILSFNWVTMLTYLFTIVTGLIFGWITMIGVEEYWTDTFYKLAKREQQKQIENAASGVEAVLTPAAYVENINSLLEEKANVNKT